MNRYRSFFLFGIYLLLVLSLSAFIYEVASNSGHKGPTHHIILDAQNYEDDHMGSTWDRLTHRVEVQPFNMIALTLFLLAIFHTFFAHKCNVISKWILDRNEKKYGQRIDSFGSEIMRFMGEVEVIFGVWVIPLLIAMAIYYDWSTAMHYINNRNYGEPLFVVVIMVLSATKPILQLAENILRFIAKLGNESVKAWWFSILTVAPLLGSLVTEPGAMTIAAILLSKQFYILKPKPMFAYATLGLLFTNISVGGVLTSFAAPPVLMVSEKWGWGTMYMFQTFGLKAIFGIFVANCVYFFFFRKEFNSLEKKRKEFHVQEAEEKRLHTPIPFWISLTHIAFLAWIVVHAHYPIICIGSFLLFLGFYQATMPYQRELSLKTPILVGFFLAGLIVHGTLQGWWISPILGKASEELLMFLSIILTAFNDNAEITFLSTLIPNFSEAMKYAVVAGAVTGGGLTVIANAPNPAGQALLRKHFDQGVSAVQLFAGALIPTIIIACSFYFLH